MENKNENIEIIETSEVIEETPKENKFKNIVSSISSFFKKFKSDKIKNEALLKKGGYSLAITALVLAGLLVFNMLVGALADRFNLEFDMTSDKKNSISQENIDYIKNLDADVLVTICGDEETYADYMNYMAQQQNITVSSYSEFEYFLQTTNLIAKYPEYNDRIKVKYVDTQSTEFTAITTNYADYNLIYGDIIVTSKVNGKERVKVLSFDDIYVTTQDQNSYYGSSTLTANRIETALTSAIAYVTSADTKKAAILSGHSNNSYTDAYQELLSTNNYEITVISDNPITSIPSDYDLLILAAPTTDLIGSELDAISSFLENDGKLGKGLVFFADASCPSLPNFYGLLKQWGIQVDEGLLFDTSDKNHYSNSPTTLFLDPVSVTDDDITESILPYIAVANYNVPMKVVEGASYERQATSFIKTRNSTVVAPVGASADWTDYTDADKQQFDCVIQSVESDFDSENNEIKSYVMAFSSVEFVQSTWSSYSDVCNQDIVMKCTDRAAHVGNTSMIFTSKVINNESFATEVTDSSRKLVNTVFMFVVPIAVIVAGIVIFIRRRNAQ